MLFSPPVGMRFCFHISTDSSSSSPSSSFTHRSDLVVIEVKPPHEPHPPEGVRVQLGQVVLLQVQHGWNDEQSSIFAQNLRIIWMSHCPREAISGFYHQSRHMPLQLQLFFVLIWPPWAEYHTLDIACTNGHNCHCHHSLPRWRCWRWWHGLSKPPSPAWGNIGCQDRASRPIQHPSPPLVSVWCAPLQILQPYHTSQLSSCLSVSK